MTTILVCALLWGHDKFSACCIDLHEVHICVKGLKMCKSISILILSQNSCCIVLASFVRASGQ